VGSDQREAIKYKSGLVTDEANQVARFVTKPKTTETA
jgi:hypothetical protein